MVQLLAVIGVALLSAAYSGTNFRVLLKESTQIW